MSVIPTREQLLSLYYEQAQIIVNIERRLHKERLSLQRIREIMAAANIQPIEPPNESPIKDSK